MVNIHKSTGAENGFVVGNRIEMIGIRVRLIAQQAVDITPTQYTVAVVSTDKYVTLTSLSGVDIMPSYGLTGFPIRFDSSKCKVLSRVDDKFMGYQATFLDTKSNDIYITWKKTLEFRDLVSSQELKEKNYYLVLYATRGGSVGITNAASFYGQVEVYYKDA